MAAPAQRAFPVGLYGLLLGALCWLAVPELTAPLERTALGLVGFSVLAHAELSATDAHAGAPPDAGAVERLCRQLDRRLRDSAEAGARALMPGGVEPVLCRAVAQRSIRGGGLPRELRLHHSYAEVQGCAPFVTWGDSLIGFLCRAGEGVAQDDRPQDRARVLLLNHPQAPSLPAAMAPAGDGAPLRFLVDAAAAVDPAPLRTVLWEDPYRASQLMRSGEAVRTLACAHGPLSAPADLLLGHAKVWGYERDGETLPIGVYVEPAVDFRALSHVVLWLRNGSEIPDAPTPGLVPAKLWPLPGSDARRFHLHAAAPVPDDAAVVRGGICIGLTRALGFRQATVVSFGATSRHWSFLLLPDDPAVEPSDLYALITPGTGGEAWLRCRPGQRPGAGYLFTGCNGPHCPPGLLLGRAEPWSEPGLIRVVLPGSSEAGPVAVVVAGPAAGGQ